VATEPSLSPLRLSPWLLARRAAGGDVASRLAEPPWDSSRPGLGLVKKPQEGIAPVQLAFLASPVRLPHLFRSIPSPGDEGERSAAWLEALSDQAARAQDMGNVDRAVAFSERLFRSVANGASTVLLAESWRLAGRRDEVVRLADAVAQSAGGIDVRFLVVLALLSRDAGDDAEAAELFSRVVASTRNPRLLSFRDVSPRLWPRTLREMTGESRPPRPG